MCTNCFSCLIKWDFVILEYSLTNYTINKTHLLLYSIQIAVFKSGCTSHSVYIWFICFVFVYFFPITTLYMLDINWLFFVLFFHTGAVLYLVTFWRERHLKWCKKTLIKCWRLQFFLFFFFRESGWLLT